MKLSLAWIFDHIEADWKQQDPNLILSKFNTTTAEIESFKPVNFGLKSFFLAKLISKNKDGLKLSVPELQTKILLPQRSQIDDISYNTESSIFMIKKSGTDFAWASLHDFGVEKEGLLPTLSATHEDLVGEWRKNFQNEDIIIEIDNKSITHRPDMWSHRGFAREIAALLNLPFKPSEQFLNKINILNFDKKTDTTSTCPVTIINEAINECSKFCGLYFKSIENASSNILIASRLLSVGFRPMNVIIDMANYLMQDWGQPVHTYDAEKIEGQKVFIRMAMPGEKLALLDGDTIKLTDQDLVIADAEKPMCLAGVKGGLDSSISTKTKSIFFEAATFDAAVVRKSAFRHKIRTDSSARFEKTLDPNTTDEAISRFLNLLNQCKIKTDFANEATSVGVKAKDVVIEVEHEFLSKRIGAELTEDDVLLPLEKIGFKVEVKKCLNNSIFYKILVPSFRASKDIKVKEDILEEVTRFYGFSKIPLILPVATKIPFGLDKIMNMRKIKNFLVFSVQMIEQQNYSFTDDEFLAEIDLIPNPTPKLLNPVSQNNSRLIDSLIPGLFKNIKINHTHKDSLAFFEFGRIWNIEDKKITESKNLAGIFFEKKADVDFYKHKQNIIDLFRVLNIDVDRIKWQKTQPSSLRKWHAGYQCANIIFNDEKIGTLGVVDPFFLSKLKIHEACAAIVFDIDGEWLLQPNTKQKRYKMFSKFQDSYFDLSFIVPLAIKFDEIKSTIQAVSPMIQKVELIDLYEKDDWTDSKALTFRTWLERFDRSLEKEEIDLVMRQAIENVKVLGAMLRK